MLLVFDFHHTLSLKSGKVNEILLSIFLKELENKIEPSIEIGINDLKTILKKYKEKNDSWYIAMKRSQLDAKIMMPTIDEIVSFVDSVKDFGYIFSVASMLEEEQFIYDLLKYCFEQRGKQSPFTLNNIVSNYSLKETDVKSKSMNDKWPHIEVILKRNGFSFDKQDIVIIDDTIDTIKYMSSVGICGVHATDYFRIDDWNRGCYSP